jgi:hypothetical protein
MRRCVYVLTAIFLLSLPAVTTRIYATDEIQYFSYLRSLWFDHDVSFENEYRHFVEAGPGTAPGFVETQLDLQTETGLRINFGTIGSAILWAPFYALADLYVIAARATGSPVARDGYSSPYVTAVAYGSAFYGFAALGLSLVIAVNVTQARPERALAAAIAVWLGTPLLFYTHLAPVFAHATSAFSVALFVFTWLRVRDQWSPRGLLALGAVGALMVMVREQDASYLVGPAIDFVWRELRATRPAIVRVAVAGALAIAAFGLVFVPQALAYKSLNGYMRPSRLVIRKMYWYSPHALQILFSPEHGLAFWTPLALVAFIGLWIVSARLWPRENDRGVAIAIAVMVIAQIYLLGALDSWTSAGGFGQRRFVGMTVFLVLGMTVLFDRSMSTSQPFLNARGAPPPRALARRLRTSLGPQALALAVVVIFTIYWNLALMALFGTELMSRQRLELRRNAYDAFVTLPRMAPSLTYRYLFDRQSFYRQP